MSVEQMIFGCIAVWLFSRWRPIYINYQNESEWRHDQSTSSGATKGIIAYRGPL